VAYPFVFLTIAIYTFIFKREVRDKFFNVCRYFYITIYVIILLLLLVASLSLLLFEFYVIVFGFDPYACRTGDDSFTTKKID